MKNIYFIIASIVALIYVISEVRRNKFSIKESFWWVVAALIMVFLAVFPYTFDSLARLLNIEYGASLLFLLCILFLLFMNFRFSRRINELEKKIIDLAQNNAILEEKLKKRKSGELYGKK